jgi:uncharacterized membrane protein
MEQMNELKSLIKDLDHRVKQIELQMKSESTDPQIDFQSMKAQLNDPEPLSASASPALQPNQPIRPHPRRSAARMKETEQPVNLLGLVGVGCIIIAVILLIKFSIDSGWLNPLRQVFLAGLFGGSLIAAPFIFKNKDSYLSQLPATGVVVLHLSIYGAIFYHHLLSPSIGIWMVWGVGLISLRLLETFKHDVFALLSIAGVYLGSFILKDNFHELTTVAVHFLVWDMIFAGYSIKLKNRSLITIAAYFSLAIMTLMSFKGMESTGEAVIIQLCQILIFSLGTALYTTKNKLILSESESWQLFPVYLFFYGIEFHLLSKLNPAYATFFSLGFGVLVLALYLFAKNRSGKAHLNSSPAVLSLVAIMFFHSIYFVKLTDQGRIIFSLVLLVFLGLIEQRLRDERFKPLSFIFLIVVGYSFMLLLANPSNLEHSFIITMGGIYAAIMLVGYRISRQAILLPFANLMIVVAISRLSHFIGEMSVGPLLVGYGFLSLFFAYLRADKLLGQAALPVIFFAIGRFFYFNFSQLTQGERIISLIIMGALIYAGGFFYKSIPQKAGK